MATPRGPDAVAHILPGFLADHPLSELVEVGVTTAVISPVAAWARMSTICASVYLFSLTSVSSLPGDTNTGAGTRTGGQLTPARMVSTCVYQRPLGRTVFQHVLPRFADMTDRNSAAEGRPPRTCSFSVPPTRRPPFPIRGISSDARPKNAHLGADSASLAKAAVDAARAVPKVTRGYHPCQIHGQSSGGEARGRMTLSQKNNANPVCSRDPQLSSHAAWVRSVARRGRPQVAPYLETSLKSTRRTRHACGAEQSHR